MNIPSSWQNRRPNMGPLYNPYANYSTDAKRNMQDSLDEDMFLHSYHLGPETLRKNLADTIGGKEKMAPKNCKIELEEETDVKEDMSPLSGIANFVSGIVNVISNVMFTRRKPAEFSSGSEPQTAPPSMWHNANLSNLNKTSQDENFADDMASEFFASEMSDCRSAAAHCQNKLDQVRLLLGTNKPSQCSQRARKRPKKVFVEPSSVDDCFEDAFSPEDFENLANESYIEFYSPVCYHDHTYHDIDSPKTKLDVAVIPKTDPVTSNSVSNPTEGSVTSKMVHEMHSVANDALNIDREVVKTKSEVSEEAPKVLSDDHLVHKVTVPELIMNKLELETKKEVVEACEDKITKLKALLQNGNKNPKVVCPSEERAIVTSSPVPPMLTLQPEPQPLVTLPPKPKPSYKIKDKKFKNRNRCTDKRRKSKMKKSIEDDLVFANEIHSEDFSSVENSPSPCFLQKSMSCLLQPIRDLSVKKVCRSDPKLVPRKDYFDEVSGCFHPSSVESNDSFQIVIHDSPRSRQESDCESDDFDIVFEDSPDNCYTSNDVLSDSDESSDSEEYDSDSDGSDSDNESTFNLSASLSKSIANLTDDSLYEDRSEDEVDCASHIQNLSICESVANGEIDDSGDSSFSNGVLLNDRKKMLKRKLPAKKVRFSPNPPKVHVMHVWLYAAKQTRVRYWQQFAVDRERFKRRIADIDMAVSWVLKPQHRARIKFQRFMPWWNAQKRKEIADKKEKEAQEQLKEDERLKNQEIEVHNDSAEEKSVNDENTNTCMSEEESTKSGDGESENDNSNVTAVSTVEAREANITLGKNRVTV